MLNPNVHEHVHKSLPLYLFYSTWKESKSAEYIHLTRILILFCHLRLGLPNSHFTLVFPTKKLYTFSSRPCNIHAPYSHSSWLCHPNYILDKPGDVIRFKRIILKNVYNNVPHKMWNYCWIQLTKLKSDWMGSVKRVYYVWSDLEECIIRGCIQKFPDWVITKYTLTILNTRWVATQRVMAAKLARLTHKIAIQLLLVAESSTICSSRSRRLVRKLLDTSS
jgi:hypothetical protein